MIRVLVADDAAEIRDALGELLDGQPQIQLVGLAADASEAAALAHELRPDVALVDVRMPGDGHRAAREIIGVSPGTRVVAMSAYDDRAAVVGMISAGACSYVTKGSAASEVIEAVERAAGGGSMLSATASQQVIGELSEQLQTRERELLDRERKLARIRQALEPGALSMVYQPIFDLARRERVGVEALARFAVEPHRTPDVWFGEAWEVGLGVDLEIAAVRAAIESLDVLPAGEFLAVNLAPETVCSPRFAEAVPAGAHPRLVLEVTEHARVYDYERLASHLEEHRRAGLRLAVDDAGAGYASLQHILSLAPDIIKLDMLLTRNVHADPRRRALVAALVPFADEIGATVIAEGIETETELDTLCSFGAGWGQGYLLGRPGGLETAFVSSSRQRSTCRSTP